MSHFYPPPAHGTPELYVLSEPCELAHSPRAIVSVGEAPDGLPWLLEADRSHKLNALFSTVLNIFELDRREDLPSGVRVALERDVSSGLMGVHTVNVEPARGEEQVYVTRRKAKRLLGPTLFAQLLESTGVHSSEPLKEQDFAATNVGALMTSDQNQERHAERLERSIQDRQAKRHLLIPLNGGSLYTGRLEPQDRALRTPKAPYLPLVFESLVQIKGTSAQFVDYSDAHYEAPLSDRDAYTQMLTRVTQSGLNGSLSFQVSRHALLDALVSVARRVADLHKRGYIHGDLAPGNLLMGAHGPVAFDGLMIKIGEPALAATFEWAAPEQIVGHGVTPRSDVFALGKIATAIIGGVAFGEQTQYIVPIGGQSARQVDLLKCEGVFVDILEQRYKRPWQTAWQSFLGRCLAFELDRRPADADAFAQELEQLLMQYPVHDHLDCPGHFGRLISIQRQGHLSFAWLMRDE